MSIDELRQLAKANGSVAKFADAFKMLEEMEQRTAELARANEELRENLEKSRKNRAELESINSIKNDIAYMKQQSEPKRITKEEILAVKNTSKRLRLIEENMDLFRKGN